MMRPKVPDPDLIPLFRRVLIGVPSIARISNAAGLTLEPDPYLFSFSRAIHQPPLNKTFMDCFVFAIQGGPMAQCRGEQKANNKEKD